MYKTYVHQFVDQMQASPDELALICIAQDGTELEFSRGQFLAAVHFQAALQKSSGLNPGDIVLLVLPHGIELFTAFWGLLLIGAIPIVYPYNTQKSDQFIFYDQISAFSLQVQVKAVFAQSSYYHNLRYHLGNTKIKIIPSQKIAYDAPQNINNPVKVDSLEQTAILQFSSGTTGAKKGVMLSYRSIINYLEAAGASLKLTPGDVFVTWLPLSHDMGLIACFMLPLTSGLPVIIMSPKYWISKPVRLLRLVHKYQGTITIMPNFAFSYCPKVITKNQLDGIDLKSWRLVINGAEMVRSENLDTFYNHFSKYGLSKSALAVGYGMAECVLGVSRTPLNSEIRVDWVDQKSLSNEGKAVSCDHNVPDAKAVVSCGRPHPMVDIKVVGETGMQLPEREVGEIRIRSTTLFSGYHLQPELSSNVMDDGWFCTGDLGYLFEGEVFVCGRKKDVIISFGKIIYPEDLEGILESYPLVRKGRTVAFGIEDGETGTELISLVCELVNYDDQNEQTKLIENVRDNVSKQFGLIISRFQIVEKGWVVKTTSGKISRSANKKKFLDAGY